MRRLQLRRVIDVRGLGYETGHWRWSGFLKEPFRWLQHKARDRNNMMAATEAEVSGRLIAVAGLPGSPIGGSRDAGVRKVAGVHLRACYQQQQDGHSAQ